MTTWPDNMPTPVLNRLIDAHLTIQLEQGGLAQLHAWQEIQWQALQGWLRARTPWWAERLQGTYGWEHPERLPVLNRHDLTEMVARYGAAPVPPHHGNVRKGNTSGSTGIAVNFFVSQFTQRMIDHAYAADNIRQGRNNLGLRAVVDARVKGNETPHLTVESDFMEGAGPILRRSFSDFTTEQHAQWLLEHRPRYLISYPGWLERLIDDAQANGWELPPLEQAMPYGAAVSPLLRRKAREILGATVRDRYSCEECGPLAFQCPHSDDYYHVAMTNVRLETVDDEGRACPPGQPGKVLVTALHQYATPLIRYDLGDIAALHPTCPGCGTGVQAMSQLLGRRLFLLRLPDGTRKALRLVVRDWLACAPVKEYRVVQKTATSFEAEVVMDRPITMEEEDAIVDMLQDAISPQLTYTVRQVESLPQTTSHKRAEVFNLLES